MALFCCNKDYAATYGFYVEDKDFLTKRIEFGYCPHCKKPVYKEQRIDFRDNLTLKVKKGYEAEVAFKRALLYRLAFISSLEQGSRARQNWHYGDYKKLPQKDEKGNFFQEQIKRNMNGLEVESLGVSKVVYI